MTQQGFSSALTFFCILLERSNFPMEYKKLEAFENIPQSAQNNYLNDVLAQHSHFKLKYRISIVSLL